MFKHEIKYVDYNGNEREETLYFNLNAAEVTKMEAKAPGGLKAYIGRIFTEQDTSKIWDLFEELVLNSYGKKTPDGAFAKDGGELAKRFSETKAYSDFMVWLLSDGGVNATAFVNGIIPSEKDMPKPKTESSNVVPIN
jgi:hypothetical protein